MLLLSILQGADRDSCTCKPGWPDSEARLAAPPLLLKLLLPPPPLLFNGGCSTRSHAASKLAAVCGTFLGLRVSPAMPDLLLPLLLLRSRANAAAAAAAACRWPAECLGVDKGESEGHSRISWRRPAKTPKPLLTRRLMWPSEVVGLMMDAAVRAAENSIRPPRDFSCSTVSR